MFLELEQHILISLYLLVISRWINTTKFFILEFSKITMISKWWKIFFSPRRNEKNSPVHQKSICKLTLSPDQHAWDPRSRPQCSERSHHSLVSRTNPEETLPLLAGRARQNGSSTAFPMHFRLGSGFPDMFPRTICLPLRPQESPDECDTSVPPAPGIRPPCVCGLPHHPFALLLVWETHHNGALRPRWCQWQFDDPRPPPPRASWHPPRSAVHPFPLSRDWSWHDRYLLDRFWPLHLRARTPLLPNTPAREQHTQWWPGHTGFWANGATEEKSSAHVIIQPREPRRGDGWECQSRHGSCSRPDQRPGSSGNGGRDRHLGKKTTHSAASYCHQSLRPPGLNSNASRNGGRAHRIASHHEGGSKPATPSNARWHSFSALSASKCGSPSNWRTHSSVTVGCLLFNICKQSGQLAHHAEVTILFLRFSIPKKCRRFSPLVGMWAPLILVATNAWCCPNE